MELLALLAIVVVLSIYFFAKSPPDASRNTFQFLEARTGEVKEEDSVTNSNVAANFQMLSVYPNIMFGIVGNVAVPMLNAIAFALGTLLIRHRVSRYKTMVEEGHGTVHGFIAGVHSFPQLKRYTTIISLSVFAAVVAFEVVFLARILSSLMGGSQTAYYTLIFGLVFFLSCAVYFGGQKTTFFADNIHLVMAYIGVHVCLGYLAATGNPEGRADVILLLIGALSIIMIIFRFRTVFLKRVSRTGRITAILIALSATYLLFTILWALPPEPHAYLVDAREKWTASFPSSPHVRAAMLLSAICPALFANFVDFSFWHRIRAVEASQSSTARSDRRLERGINIFLVEAPLSWILPVAIGMLALTAAPRMSEILQSGTEDPVAGMVQWLLGSPGLMSAIGLLFVVGLVSVTVSTVDSYLTSLSYLFAKDIASEKRNEGQRVAAGRAFQFLVALTIVLIFVVLDVLVAQSVLLLSIFLTVFAPLAAMSPLVVWPLINGKKYASPSLLGRVLLVGSSVGAGIFGLCLGVWSVIAAPTPDELLYWAPIPTAFICSWVLYLIYVLTAKTEQPKPNEGKEYSDA